MLMVDPPEGWRYGFPKAFDFEPSHPNLPGEELWIEEKEWWVENGYPIELIRKGYLDHCRMWNTNDDTGHES